MLALAGKQVIAWLAKEFKPDPKAQHFIAVQGMLSQASPEVQKQMQEG